MKSLVLSTFRTQRILNVWSSTTSAVESFRMAQLILFVELGRLDGPMSLRPNSDSFDDVYTYL